MKTVARRNKLLLCVFGILLALALLIVGLTPVFVDADETTAKRLEYVGVKYRVAQTAPQTKLFSDTRKGLRLYAYDDGARASFKGAYSGTFTIETKATTAEKTKPDLSAYTFRFESVTTGEAFGVTVEDYGEYTMTYVSVGEDKTGIFYNVDTSWDGAAHGYTTMQNEVGNYTKTLTSGTNTLRFEPSTMTISVKNSGGKQAWQTVWSLSESVQDGKAFGHVLESMDLYTVSLEFTKIAVGGKGELTLYTVNDEDFGSIALPSATPSVYFESVENAVVNAAYALPQPNVYDPEGKLTSEDVSYTIYDGTGAILAQENYRKGASFTPTASGTYYLLYQAKSSNGAIAEKYVKIKAYTAENVSVQFATSLVGKTVGLHSSVEIAQVYVESNLLEDGKRAEAWVTIKKDGKAVDGYERKLGGFTYRFDALGAYEVVYGADIGGTTREAAPVAFLVDENTVGIDRTPLEAYYAYGATFTLPQGQAYAKGAQEAVQTTLITPSGKRIADDSAVLDEVGVYTMEYAYSVAGVIGAETENFTVKYAAEDLFEVSGKASLVYDEATGNADLPGMLFTMTANDATLTYDVDLSNNTKDDVFIELFAVAATPGVSDMTGFYVTLTDKLDPSNYVTIRVIDGSPNMGAGTYIKGRACNQGAWTGYYKDPHWTEGTPYKWTETIENAMAHNAGGYVAAHDFTSIVTTSDFATNKTVKLYYDTEEKAVYTVPAYDFVKDKNQRERLVVDFDDLALFSNAWGGFTDNSQVELKITPVTLTSTARLKITQINGYFFGGENVEDTKAPEVTVNMNGASKAPNAKTGVAYKIFDLTVKDDFCASESLRQSVRVTYGNTEIEVKDGAFLPQTDGFYKITYLVADAYGNETVKTVEVEARSDVTAVKASLTDSAWATSAVYGAKFYFPAYCATGGNGSYTYTTEVTCNGAPVETEADGFVPLQSGNYVVKLIATDSIGQMDTLEKTYTVSFSDEVLVDEAEIVLPPAFIDGNPYVFEEYVGYYYATEGGEKTEVCAKIEVVDGNGVTTLGADRKYIPCASETVKEATVRFLFEGVKTHTVERKAQIRTIGNTSGFITEYFQTENATLTAKSQWLTFEAAEAGKDLVATFIRSVNADNFSVQFQMNERNGESRSNFDALEVTLTDKRDPSVRVVCVITKNGSGLLASVNGGAGVAMVGSLTDKSTQNIALMYDDATHTITAADNATVAVVKTTSAGKAFDGFNSHEVFVSFRLTGVQENCAINFISINNQRFINTIRDTSQPQLIVDGSYSGMYTPNTKITLPMARAYDVLNYTDVPLLTVKTPDGGYLTTVDGVSLNGVPANREYVVQPSALGRYTVIYTATDFSGLKKESTKSIVIFDDVLPTLTVTGELPVRVWTGTTIYVPTYEIADNGDVEKVTVDTYYRAPNGVLHVIKDGKFTAEQAGTYSLIFYIMDENGNYNVLCHDFEVVQKN